MLYRFLWDILPNVSMISQKVKFKVCTIIGYCLEWCLCVIKVICDIVYGFYFRIEIPAKAGLQSFSRRFITLRYYVYIYILG